MTLLTYQQAAERVGLSVRTLHKEVGSGRIVAHRLGPRGGRVRFAPEDLDQYLRECRKVGAR
jgi:excisionase family DNA binding protein